eukprot:6640337-Prymnesium_polylepis.1
MPDMSAAILTPLPLFPCMYRAVSLPRRRPRRLPARPLQGRPRRPLVSSLCAVGNAFASRASLGGQFGPVWVWAVRVPTDLLLPRSERAQAVAHPKDQCHTAQACPLCSTARQNSVGRSVLRLSLGHIRGLGRLGTGGRFSPGFAGSRSTHTTSV